MRVRADLKPVGKQLLDINYNQYVNSAIYHAIAKHDKTLATKLHNKSGVKFTFSRLMCKKRKILGGKILFEGLTQLYFTSPFEEVCHAFVNGLLELQELKISNSVFEIVGIKVLKEAIKDKMMLKTLSPILVYKNKVDGRKVQLNPDSEEFYRALTSNLIKKHHDVYGTPPDSEEGLEFEVLNVKPASVRVKGCWWTCYQMVFSVSGSENLIRVGYMSGFGMKNPYGFGMVAPVT